MAKGANFRTGPNARNIALEHYPPHILEESPPINLPIGNKCQWS